LVEFLRQFYTDQELALKFLESIQYFTRNRTMGLIRQLRELIRTETNQTLTNIYFCPMNMSSGSSSDWVLNDLRHALRMNVHRYDSQFIYPSNLVEFADNADPRTVVFVDDMIGSGKTVTDFWLNVRQNPNPNNQYYVATLLGYQSSIQHIETEEPDLQVITAEAPMPESAKIFHSSNTDFTNNEKEILKRYCRNVSSSEENAYGFRDTQSMVVFYTRAPNNALPILYSKRNGWFPLFPRDGSRY